MMDLSIRSTRIFRFTCIIFISLFFLLLGNSSHAQSIKESVSFISPVDFPIVLSANFGELRSDHFHSGIDIKTEGESGKKIRAVESGYISRISVTPGGFGKAIYLSHPSGHTTVYGHLSNFTTKVENFVKENQYQKKTFNIHIFPKSGEFQYKKGEVIGYSGNTGSSFGPHLHFEIRDSKTEKPLNPLLYNFEIEDTIQPKIFSIYIYPLTHDSHVDFQNRKKRINVEVERGIFSLQNKNPILVGGKIGIGIETNDYLNKARNRCGVYSIELLLDQVPLFFQELDAFSFSESRYINSHIDYEEKIMNNVNIHQTFVDPNNKLSVYKILKNRGVLSFYDNENHEITLIIKDAYQNESRLVFVVESRWNHGEEIVKSEETYSRMMIHNLRNEYRHNGFSVVIPPGALYDTLYFNYAKSPRIAGSFSEVHHVHNKFTPVHLDFDMRIVPDSTPDHIRNKLLIAGLDDDEIFYVGGEYSEGAVEVRTRNFGRFIVVADTVPPEINPATPVNNSNLSGKRLLRFRITDDLSGIRSYNGFIDNEWVVFEYDPKNDRLTYRFDHERLTKNSNHELVLTVIDNKENISVYHANFYW